MAYFLLKRIFLIIPTLLLIALTAFFLSKLVPGDPADSMMTLQGITSDNPREKQEYAKLYKDLHLDIPIFYCSLLPNFYPDNINKIIDRDERNLAKALLKQKVPFRAIQSYLKSRDIFLSVSTQDSLAKSLWSEWKNPIRFESDLNILAAISTTLQLTDTQLQFVVNQLIASIQNMKSAQVHIYYPTWRWQGTQNQFHQWLVQIFEGNFGISTKDGRAVLPKIGTAIQWTLLLSIISLLISLIISVPLGLYTGLKQGTRFDKVNQVIWLIFYAMPVFWLASLLIIYCTSDRYGSWLNIFQIPGLWYIPKGQSTITAFLNYSHQLILPILCMVANDIAPFSTLVRNNVIEQKSKPYILMAYAKGLKPNKILFNHILPNVMLPLITIIGGRLASAMSGALIIEVIFNIPGMGRLMYDSIYAGDWNVVFGILLVLGAITMIVLTITDILYAWYDPRVRSKIRKA